MRREELAEFHYITPLANLTSILKWGIQSHRRAMKVEHASVALQDVQDKRENVQIPGGRPLHEYANLYFCARNPMMFKRKEQHDEICVLRIDPDVLEIAGAVVCDRNAAAGVPRFASAPKGLEIVNAEMVFAEDWRHPGDKMAYLRHKAIKCAEALIPDKVPPTCITGAYVSCAAVQEAIMSVTTDLAVEINGDLFFYIEGS